MSGKSASTFLGLLLLGVFTLLAPPCALAQTGGGGSIQGTITDSGGAVLAGATVVATNVATKVESTRRTNEAGRYVISPLPPGEYTVSVSATGFQTLIQGKVIVDALSAVSINLTLKVGNVADTVTVADAPPQLNITDARLGTTIRNELYTNLPLAMGTAAIITFNLNANLPGPDGKSIGTFRTPTAQIDGDGFAAENITFENSAGPVGQALALRVDGDRVSFKNCRFLGWQDTILLNRGRQYFENCYIAGHVDFIFGAATAFFESCHIHCLRDGYITAASTPADQPFGFVFSRCKITGENPAVKTYLGRPWRAYGATIFLSTEMSEVVRPVGWHNWTGPEREKTARYAEFNSSGPGGQTQSRVSDLCARFR